MTLSDAATGLPVLRQTGFERNGPPPHDDHIDIQRLLKALRRRKLAVLVPMIVATMGAVLLLSQLTPRYSAMATVVLDVRKTQIVNSVAVLSGLPPEAAVVRSEVDVMRSRSLAGKVVDRLALAEQSHPVARVSRSGALMSGLRAWLSGEAPPPSAPELEIVRRRNNAIDTVLDNLSASNDGRSYSIQIAYTSPDPQKAAAIANALAEAYLDNQLDEKNDSIRKASAWLSERITDLQRQIQESEQAIQSYRERTKMVETRGSTVTIQQLVEINARLIQASADRAQAEARYHTVQDLMAKSGDMDSSTDVLNSPLIQGLRQQESIVQRKAAELANEYGPRHPRLLNAEAEMRDVRKKIAEEIKRVLVGLKGDLSSASTKEKSLEAALAQLESKANKASVAEVDLRQLEREADANRKLYETYLARYKETSEQQVLQKPDARLISAAEVPTHASWPKKLPFLTFAWFLGTAIGLLAAFLRERLDQTFRLSGQVEAVTGYPVLGVIPQLPRGERKRPKSYVLEKPRSAFAEALQTTGAAINIQAGGRLPRIVVVTSSVPGEGKSTLCVALAASLATNGNSVLLVDGDLRRPRIAELLGRNQVSRDISDMLRHSESAESLIQIDPETGVHFIAARPNTSNPHMIFRAVARFLDDTAKSYDCVLIDTPPILAVSDAAVISQVADACLYVVRWGETPRDVVTDGMSRMKNLGGKIVGVALTGVDSKRHAGHAHGTASPYYGKYLTYYEN